MNDDVFLDLKKTADEMKVHFTCEQARVAVAMIERLRLERDALANALVRARKAMVMAQNASLYSLNETAVQEARAKNKVVAAASRHIEDHAECDESDLSRTLNDYAAITNKGDRPEPTRVPSAGQTRRDSK